MLHAETNNYIQIFWQHPEEIFDDIKYFSFLPQWKKNDLIGCNIYSVGNSISENQAVTLG